jgi:hypothetical protein
VQLIDDALPQGVNAGRRLRKRGRNIQFFGGTKRKKQYRLTIAHIRTTLPVLSLLVLFLNDGSEKRTTPL